MAKPGRKSSYSDAIADEITIYALLDADGTVRYVGKANDAQQRLASHLRDMHRRNTPLYSWLRKRISEGFTPTVRVLEKCGRESWQDRERHWIAQYRESGNLLNLAEGGDEPFCPIEVRRANGKKIGDKRGKLSTLAAALGKEMAEKNANRMREQLQARGERPFDQTVADEICRRLADGESLISICRDENMPAESTVRKWAWSDTQGFYAQYAHARDIGLDHRCDKLLELAADKSRDPNCRRVELDTIKWYLSKLAPKRYGDRLELAGDKDAPLLPPCIRVELVKKGEE